MGISPSLAVSTFNVSTWRSSRSLREIPAVLRKFAEAALSKYATALPFTKHALRPGFFATGRTIAARPRPLPKLRPEENRADEVEVISSSSLLSSLLHSSSSLALISMQIGLA